MEIAGFPRIASLGCSALLPYTDEVDITCTVEAYHTPSGNNMDSYFNPGDLFDRPTASAKMFLNHQTKQQDALNSTLPTVGTSAVNRDAGQQQPFHNANFGQFDQYPFGLAYDPGPLASNDLTYFSPNTHAISRTPSLCGDAPQEACSPTPTKPDSRRSSASLSSDTASKRALRKRARSRPEHSSTSSKSTPPSSNPHRPSRLPHNQVERKYREGLNYELERLRQAIPSLSQANDDDPSISHPKPSKAMVLSRAVEYIAIIQTERDRLKDENDRLRQRHARLQSWKHDPSLEEFLIDP